MADSALLQEKRSPDGTIAGLLAKGHIFFDAGLGLVMLSPNGTMFQLTVDDNGALSAVQVTLP